MNTYQWISNKRPDVRGFPTQKSAQEKGLYLGQSLVRIQFAFETLYFIYSENRITDNAGHDAPIRLRCLINQENQHRAHFAGFADPYARLRRIPDGYKDAWHGAMWEEIERDKADPALFNIKWGPLGLRHMSELY